MNQDELLQIIEKAKQDRRTVLDLSGNQLTSLPSEIGELHDLQFLNLRRNQLTILPPEMVQLHNLQKLDLRDNPLPIPSEVLVETENILNYIRDLNQRQTYPLNAAKMLLVGQGGVGKTSLVKRLINDNFDPHEATTHGIQISSWCIQIGPLIEGFDIRRNSLEQQRLNIVLIAILMIGAAVLSSFVYAAYTKDSALPQTIIIALLGAGSGAGLLAGLSNLLQRESQ